MDPSQGQKKVGEPPGKKSSQKDREYAGCREVQMMLQASLHGLDRSGITTNMSNMVLFIRLGMLMLLFMSEVIENKTACSLAIIPSFIMHRNAIKEQTDSKVIPNRFDQAE